MKQTAIRLILFLIVFLICMVGMDEDFITTAIVWFIVVYTLEPVLMQIDR
jgi:hypothetical protein